MPGLSPTRIPAVHPHARGEHATSAFFASAAAGSSPRPWGTLMSAFGRLGKVRFIPTPVGNTWQPRSVKIVRTVHPHARGEHTFEIVPCLTPDGSSPRPWGTRRCPALPPHPFRFIPTPVGNTCACSPLPSGLPVHPHARGEHTAVWPRVRLPSGSSPRPWGTRNEINEGDECMRFIPTPVGNTVRPFPPSITDTVHPHARGEHSCTPFTNLPSHGSSPRPWGTLDPMPGAGSLTRFIPTPVGNTGICQHRGIARQVHPHARGEHRKLLAQLFHGHGSSPRPWGTPAPPGISAAIRRFIPTPVGNTLRDRLSGHQHGGSSPRPWGTHHPHRRIACFSRFIPTPVGNTTAEGSPTHTTTVHPHARGEHAVPYLGCQVVWRFIPTPVGNTRRGTRPQSP